MHDNTNNKLYQKTQSLNIRISPNFKSEIIQKASLLNLNLSEYIEFVLTNEQIKDKTIQEEKRKKEEVLTHLEKSQIDNQNKDQEWISIFNRINGMIESYPQFPFSKIETTNGFIELLKKLLNDLSEKDETKTHLQFFIENKHLLGIFYKVKGQEIKYFKGETIESTTPQTLEDLFLILVHDYHAKINLNKK